MKNGNFFVACVDSTSSSKVLMHNRVALWRKNTLPASALLYRRFCPWHSATILTKGEGHFERHLKIPPVGMCLQWGHLWNTANWEMQWNLWLQPQQGISGRTLQPGKQLSCYFIRQPVKQPNHCQAATRQAVSSAKLRWGRCHTMGTAVCKNKLRKHLQLYGEEGSEKSEGK